MLLGAVRSQGGHGCVMLVLCVGLCVRLTSSSPPSLSSWLGCGDVCWHVHVCACVHKDPLHVLCMFMPKSWKPAL